MSNNDTASATPRRDGAALQRERASFPIDLSALAQISGGDRAIEIRMLSTYRKSNDADAAALGDALKRQDMVGVAHVAHRLMGASRVAGAMALASLCESVVQAALAGNWGGVAAASEACYRELERVNAFLRNIDETRAPMA